MIIMDRTSKDKYRESAFEQFLASLIATILTLVFSWRLLTGPSSREHLPLEDNLDASSKAADHVTNVTIPNKENEAESSTCQPAAGIDPRPSQNIMLMTVNNGQVKHEHQEYGECSTINLFPSDQEKSGSEISLLTPGNDSRDSDKAIDSTCNSNNDGGVVTAGEFDDNYSILHDFIRGSDATTDSKAGVKMATLGLSNNNDYYSDEDSSSDDDEDDLEEDRYELRLYGPVLEAIAEERPEDMSDASDNSTIVNATDLEVDFSSESSDTNSSTSSSEGHTYYLKENFKTRNRPIAQVKSESGKTTDCDLLATVNSSASVEIGMRFSDDIAKPETEYSKDNNYDSVTIGVTFSEEFNEPVLSLTDFKPHAQCVTKDQDTELEFLQEKRHHDQNAHHRTVKEGESTGDNLTKDVVLGNVANKVSGVRICDVYADSSSAIADSASVIRKSVLINKDDEFRKPLKPFIVTRSQLQPLEFNGTHSEVFSGEDQSPTDDRTNLHVNSLSSDKNMYKDQESFDNKIIETCVDTGQSSTERTNYIKPELDCIIFPHDSKYEKSIESNTVYNSRLCTLPSTSERNASQSGPLLGLGKHINNSVNNEKEIIRTGHVNTKSRSANIQNKDFEYQVNRQQRNLHHNETLVEKENWDKISERQTDVIVKSPNQSMDKSLEKSHSVRYKQNEQVPGSIDMPSNRFQLDEFIEHSLLTHNDNLCSDKKISALHKSESSLSESPVAKDPISDYETNLCSTNTSLPVDKTVLNTNSDNGDKLTSSSVIDKYNIDSVQGFIPNFTGIDHSVNKHYASNNKISEQNRVEEHGGTVTKQGLYLDSHITRVGEAIPHGFTRKTNTTKVKYTISDESPEIRQLLKGSDLEKQSDTKGTFIFTAPRENVRPRSYSDTIIQKQSRPQLSNKTSTDRIIHDSVQVIDTNLGAVKMGSDMSTEVHNGQYTNSRSNKGVERSTISKGSIKSKTGREEQSLSSFQQPTQYVASTHELGDQWWESKYKDLNKTESCGVSDSGYEELDTDRTVAKPSPMNSKTCTAIAKSTALAKRDDISNYYNIDEIEASKSIVSAVACAEATGENPYIAVARATARAAVIASSNAASGVAEADGNQTEDVNIVISTSCSIKGEDRNKLLQDSTEVTQAFDRGVKVCVKILDEFRRPLRTTNNLESPTKRTKLLTVTLESAVPMQQNSYKCDPRTFEVELPAHICDSDLTDVVRSSVQETLCNTTDEQKELSSGKCNDVADLITRNIVQALGVTNKTGLSEYSFTIPFGESTTFKAGFPEYNVLNSSSDKNISYTNNLTANVPQLKPNDVKGHLIAQPVRPAVTDRHSSSVNDPAGCPTTDNQFQSENNQYNTNIHAAAQSCATNSHPVFGFQTDIESSHLKNKELDKHSGLDYNNITCSADKAGGSYYPGSTWPVFTGEPSTGEKGKSVPSKAKEQSGMAGIYNSDDEFSYSRILRAASHKSPQIYSTLHNPEAIDKAGNALNFNHEQRTSKIASSVLSDACKKSDVNYEVQEANLTINEFYDGDICADDKNLNCDSNQRNYHDEYMDVPTVVSMNNVSDSPCAISMNYDQSGVEHNVLDLASRSNTKTTTNDGHSGVINGRESDQYVNSLNKPSGAGFRKLENESFGENKGPAGEMYVQQQQREQYKSELQNKYKDTKTPICVLRQLEMPEKQSPLSRTKIIDARQGYLQKEQKYNTEMFAKINKEFEQRKHRGSSEVSPGIKEHPAFANIEVGTRSNPLSNVEATKRSLENVRLQAPDSSQFDKAWISVPSSMTRSYDQGLDDSCSEASSYSMARSVDNLQRTSSVTSLAKQFFSDTRSYSSLLETDLDTGEHREISIVQETDVDSVSGKVKSMTNLCTEIVSTFNTNGWDKTQSMDLLQNSPPETDFRLNDFNQNTDKCRVKSEHEIKIARSLDRLSVPEWYRSFRSRKSSNSDSSCGFQPIKNEKIGSCPPDCWDTRSRSGKVHAKPVVIRHRVSTPNRSRSSSETSVDDNKPFSLPSAKLRETRDRVFKPIKIKSKEEIMQMVANVKSEEAKQSARDLYLKLRNSSSSSRSDIESLKSCSTSSSRSSEPCQYIKKPVVKYHSHTSDVDKKPSDVPKIVTCDKEKNFQINVAQIRHGNVREDREITKSPIHIDQTKLHVLKHNTAYKTAGKHASTLQNNKHDDMKAPVNNIVPLLGEKDNVVCTKTSSSSTFSQVTANVTAKPNATNNFMKNSYPESNCSGTDLSVNMDDRRNTSERDVQEKHDAFPVLSYVNSPGSRRKKYPESPRSGQKELGLQISMADRKKAKADSESEQVVTGNTSFEEIIDGLLALSDKKSGTEDISDQSDSEDHPPSRSLQYLKQIETPQSSLTSVATPRNQGAHRRPWESSGRPLLDTSHQETQDTQYSSEAEDGLGAEVIMVKCRNTKCAKSAELEEARKNYKTCHNCYTYYCSRQCRKNHWERHKKKCLYSRVNSCCKHVIKCIHDDSELTHHVSRIARTGYLSMGRGCVMLVFTEPYKAEEFIHTKGTSVDIPASYTGLKDLQESNIVDEHISELIQMCKAYNPEIKFVIDVAVVIKNVESELIKPFVVPRHEGPTIHKCAKLRLSSVIASSRASKRDEPETLILTAVPGSEYTENMEERKAREVCFINIQRKLRQRGVSLRHHYPQIYTKLCAYVSSKIHFTPIIIYPYDGKTGRRFMCVIMPESEPEVEWLQDPDLLEELDLTTDV